MTRKVEACLENIALGLIANPGLSIEPLLMLIHGVISLSVPELRLPAPRIQEDSNLTVSGKPMKTDSLIIAPVPKRKVAAAAQPSVSGLSRSAYVINSHYVVEFGLLVLSHLLKREKCHEGDANPKVLPMLDPMVSIVYENLNNPHSKVNERFSFFDIRTFIILKSKSVGGVIIEMHLYTSSRSIAVFGRLRSQDIFSRLFYTAQVFWKHFRRELGNGSNSF